MLTFISFLVTFLNDALFILFLLDRQDCKWDISDINNQPIKGATAIYHIKTENVAVKANLTFEQFYIFQGRNQYKTMVYLSEKANYTEKWNQQVDVTMKSDEETEPRSITVDIADTKFYSFLLKNGLSRLRCNNRRCGCNNKLCNKAKKFGYLATQT